MPRLAAFRGMTMPSGPRGNLLNDEVAIDDARKVAAAMREYMRRCDEITELLGDKHSLKPHEREDVTRLYKSLKDDIRAAAKYGTVSGRPGVRTLAEDAFLDPALRKAGHRALRAATNSHPISSNWRGCVWEAGTEFSYYLDQLKRRWPIGDQ
jgi:hypothetical protein